MYLPILKSDYIACYVAIGHVPPTLRKDDISIITFLLSSLNCQSWNFSMGWDAS